MDLTNVPDHAKAGLLAMNADKPLVNLDQKELAGSIIERYTNGEKIEDIALEYKVDPTRLYQVLVENAEQDWKRATTAKALSRHYEAIGDMQTAPDGLSLNRAREVARASQWELERVCRRIYGTDTPQVQINFNVGDIMGKIKDLEEELLPPPRTIEHE